MRCPVRDAEAVLDGADPEHGFHEHGVGVGLRGRAVALDAAAGAFQEGDVGGAAAERVGCFGRDGEDDGVGYVLGFVC